MVNVGSFPVLTTAAYRAAGFRKRLLLRAQPASAGHRLGIPDRLLLRLLHRAPPAESPAALGRARRPRLHLAIAPRSSSSRPNVADPGGDRPVVLGASLGAYLFYAQHNFPAAEIRAGSEWDYVFAALRSSSYMAMNPILGWFTANIGYHHIHHLNSRIPFYRLPETMAAIEELQSPGRTSLQPARHLPLPAAQALGSGQEPAGELQGGPRAGGGAQDRARRGVNAIPARRSPPAMQNEKRRRLRHGPSPPDRALPAMPPGPLLSRCVSGSYRPCSSSTTCPATAARA